MKKPRYRLRLAGFPQKRGRIALSRLAGLLDALQKTAERATRLAAEGEGRGSGRRPAWLQAAADFTVIGIESGSSALVIDAPVLREAACGQFARKGFWLKRPDLDGTALDIVVSAVNEAVRGTSRGDHFDRSVLNAVLAFKRPTGGAGIGVELRREGSGGIGFELNERLFRQVERHRRNIPRPRMCLVSGRLGGIQHGGGRFRLLLGKRLALPGRFPRAALDPEMLRPLRGKPVLVQGRAHFKVDRKPRMIEAVMVVKCEQEDNFFRKLPVPESDTSELLSKTTRKGRRAGGFDPLVLAGSWPGDESFEDLVADLH